MQPYNRKFKLQPKLGGGMEVGIWCLLCMPHWILWSPNRRNWVSFSSVIWTLSSPCLSTSSKYCTYEICIWNILALFVLHPQATHYFFMWPSCMAYRRQSRSGPWRKSLVAAAVIICTPYFSGQLGPRFVLHCEPEFQDGQVLMYINAAW